jgi:peptide/nickel transport system substrate-binding protein
MSRNKLMLAFGLLVIASMVLTACAAPTPVVETKIETVVVTQVVEKEGETVVETVVQVVISTPEPVKAVERTLVICQGQEPDTLYPYKGAMLAKSHVLEAIYDGPIDARSYAYQAIILEKLPSLADGDAVLNAVTVKEGDKVVDKDQNVITLDAAADPKQMIIPAGMKPDEAIEYTGGEVQMDQLVVTFKLLPGLMWSDGTPLTAKDSVYSFNLLADPDTDQPKFVVERTASYEATDDVTNVWTGLPGYKDSTYYINFYTPYPEHVWGQFTAAELNEAEESSRAPLGWGAYIVDEWTQGDNIRLHKNPNYFRASEGLPKFEHVVYRFAGEGSNANIAAVLSGECDIVDQTSGLDDQSELLLELQSAGQINATFVTGTTWEHVDFGIQHISYDDGFSLAAGDRPDLFSDLRVRKAFAMCMDRQAVVDTALYGQSIVIDTYLPPQHPLFNKEVAHYDFDVAAAGALLDEVGWKDADGDPATPRVATGVAGVPDGTQLVVSYETTTATLRQQVTQILQQSLAQCGIKAELNYYPASEWFADGPEGKLFGRRFDLGEFAWLTGVQPGCDLYKSDGVPGADGESFISIMRPNDPPIPFAFGWGGQNDPGYSNPAYDAACNKGITALPGQPEYDQGHLEAQKIFGDELPVVPLFLRLKLAATRPDMCNFIMDPTANSEFWNIEEFDYGDC